MIALMIESPKRERLLTKEDGGMAMSTLDTGVLLCYFLVLVVAGILGARRAKTAEDFALAGRNLGLFVYLGCLSAVILGGASTIGTAKLGYQFGISGMWFVFMIGLGITVLGLFFTNQIYGANVTTISELLGRRYNQETRLISALVAAIYTLMVSVTQVIGMGTIIHAVLGWDMTVSMLVGGRNCVVLHDSRRNVERDDDGHHSVYRHDHWYFLYYVADEFVPCRRMGITFGPIASIPF